MIDRIARSARPCRGAVAPAAMRSGLCAASALVLALVAVPALADAPTQKPGLWEHSMQFGGGKMDALLKEQQAAMANLPPDQRKMMEQMMAKQGVNMDAGGQKVRVCVTPEDAAREAPAPAQEGCKQTAQRSGNTWNISYECPAREGRPATKGRGTMTLTSPTAYEGQFTTETTVGKKTEQMTMNMQGRWVAADCGAVKPVKR